MRNLLLALFVCFAAACAAPSFGVMRFQSSGGAPANLTAPAFPLATSFSAAGGAAAFAGNGQVGGEAFLLHATDGLIILQPGTYRASFMVVLYQGDGEGPVGTGCEFNVYLVPSGTPYSPSLTANVISSSNSVPSVFQFNGYGLLTDVTRGETVQLLIQNGCGSDPKNIGLWAWQITLESLF